MPTIVQLTDLHLFSEPDVRLRGVPTRHAFREVLDYLDDRLASRGARVERWIITGDLAHDEQRATYLALRDLLGDRVDRCRLVPGNHDHRASIEAVFPEWIDASCGRVCFSEAVDGWRLIGLDSHQAGAAGGRLGGEQRDWLDRQLQQHDAQPTLLFLHHPPFSVGSPWLDAIGLEDAPSLWGIVERHAQVRAISTGHVHHAWDERRDGIRLLATPATSVQFRARSERPINELLPPGFRLFELDAGAFETRVERLPELRFPPEPS